jgi:hypothetical protein
MIEAFTYNMLYLLPFLLIGRVYVFVIYETRIQLIY